MTTPNDWTHPAPPDKTVRGQAPASLDTLELSRDILRDIPASEIYALRIKGDSLLASLLCDGDQAILRRVTKPEHEKLMEVEINGDHILRNVLIETVGLANTPTGRLKLVAESHAQPVIWAEAGTWKVCGIVKMVIRHV